MLCPPAGGGGASKLNIDAVMAQLEELGGRYPFQIPAFFALILRAFSVIEGIALQVRVLQPRCCGTLARPLCLGCGGVRTHACRKPPFCHKSHHLIPEPYQSHLPPPMGEIHHLHSAAERSCM
jgi:hypothetical protein